MNKSRLAAIVAASASAFLLAACGGDLVSQSSLEDQLLLDEPTIESASCPDDIDSEAGATFTCTATTTDGEEFDVPGEVTELQGDVPIFEYDYSNNPAASGATGAEGAS